MYGFADRNIAVALKEMAQSRRGGTLDIAYQNGSKGAQLYLVSPKGDIPAARYDIASGAVYLGRGKAVLYRVKPAETTDETAERELEKIDPEIEIDIFNPFPIEFRHAQGMSAETGESGSQSTDDRTERPRIYQAWRDAYGQFHLADMPTKIFAKLKGDLESGSTAQAKIIDKDGNDKTNAMATEITMTVRATPLQKDTIENGTRVIVEYISDEGDWYVTAAACEPDEDEEEQTGEGTE